MAGPKKHFAPACRDEAVRLVQTSGRSRREIAEDLGVGLSRLRNWIKARRRRAMEEPPPDRQEDIGGGHGGEDMAAELTRLRRENEVLREVREILKRATTPLAEAGRR